MKTPTSSKYPVLDNKPIDQLKVTELKEELKKRRLKTGGLKDELIRRLDEALRAELEDTIVEGDSDNGIAVDGDGGNDVAVEETAPEIVVADAPGNLTEHPAVDADVLGFESSGIAEETMVKVEETVGNAEEPMVKAKEAVGTAEEPVVQAEEAVSYAEEPVVKAEEVVGNDEGAVGYVERNVSKEDANAVPLETDKVIGEELSKNGTYEEQQSGLGNAPVFAEGIVSEAYTASGIVGGDVSKVQQLGLADDPLIGDAMIMGEVTEGLDGLIDSKMGSDIGDSGKQDDSENIMPAHEDMKLDSSDQTNQVSEVSTSLGFTVKSNNSVSTDSVSIIEKNDLKDNLIADNVNLETSVKPEMVLPSSSDLVPDGGESHPGDVDQPLENMVSVGETDNSVANADVSQKNYSADLGSEKLNLDRSSGDDSMEEDALESKQIDSIYNSEVVGEKTEKIDATAIKVDNPVATAMDTDLPAESKVIHDQKSDVANLSEKRKLTDEEAVVNNKPAKRQHRWKKESNITEPQYSDILPPVSAKEVPQNAVLIQSFSRSDSIGANDPPKEREVPPSAKPATNSLRIDNFLRPFTLKAAQELLGKSGTVSSFWMDHIKTHCYVTYSSIEEAEATRNAVYNLQWPPNGGRQLVAEFVDPEEVKLRLEPPPPTTTAPPATSAPTKCPEGPTGPLPSPRQQNLRQQTTLPPPPPMPNQIPARERVAPPPPPIEKVDAPIVTLDDLFRKTKATPRIYYLPLSDEQVAAKRKNLKQ